MATKIEAWSASGKRAKAMSDEKRVTILQHLVEEGPMANTELAERLGYSVSVVGYHLHQLARFDCIEVAGTEVVKGGKKTYWRAIDTDFIGEREWGEMDDSRKVDALLGVFSWVERDFDHALANNRFGDDGRWWLVRNALKSVDQQALDDLLKLHEHLFEKSNEIQREAAERLRQSGENPIRIMSASQCFEVDRFGNRE